MSAQHPDKSGAQHQPDRSHLVSRLQRPAGASSCTAEAAADAGSQGHLPAGEARAAGCHPLQRGARLPLPAPMPSLASPCQGRHYTACVPATAHSSRQAGCSRQACSTAQQATSRQAASSQVSRPAPGARWLRGQAQTHMCRLKQQAATGPPASCTLDRQRVVA